MSRRNRWIERGDGILGTARAAQRCRVALELVRDRQSREVLAEHDDEPEVRIVERVQPVVQRASQPSEQADVVEAAVAGRREPFELCERPLAGRLRHERRRRAEQGLGALVHAESELVLEPHRTQEPERVVDEDRLGDRPDDAGRQIGAAVVRIVRLAGAHRHGDRVEREVARREVGVDPLADRREVDRLGDAVRDDPPGSVPLGERKDRPAEAACEAIRRVTRLRARDVEVENGPQEELVSHGPADDPRVLVPEDLAEALIHRSRPAGHAPSACSSPSRSRTRSCPRRVRAPR